MRTRRVTRLYEVWGCTFLRNVGKFLPVYKASHIKRLYSSKYCRFLCFAYINYLLHKRYQASRRRNLYYFNELGCGGFAPVKTIHAHRGNGIMAPLILTSAPDEGKWPKFKPRLLHFRWKSHGVPHYEAGWAPESIWTLTRRCRSLYTARNWRKTPPLSSTKAIVTVQWLQGKACSLISYIFFMFFWPCIIL
jgi:hypothetical protein